MRLGRHPFHVFHDTATYALWCTCTWMPPAATAPDAEPLLGNQCIDWSAGVTVAQYLAVLNGYLGSRQRALFQRRGGIGQNKKHVLHSTPELEPFCLTAPSE